MRTKSILAATTLLFTTLVQAQGLNNRLETFNRISKQDSFQTQVTVDSTSVRCSHIGYGMAELKISVPGLRWNAIFDHANIGESEPCMTAGACAFPWDDEHRGFKPEDLIQDNPGQENMLINRQLVESFILDHDFKTCRRHLSEILNSTLRGIKFNHTVVKSIGDLPFETCLELQQL